MSILEIKDILKKEADAILNIPINNNYTKVIDLIENNIHKKKRENSY